MKVVSVMKQRITLCTKQCGIFTPFLLLVIATEHIYLCVTCTTRDDIKMLYDDTLSWSVTVPFALCQSVQNRLIMFGHHTLMKHAAL